MKKIILLLMMFAIQSSIVAQKLDGKTKSDYQVKWLMTENAVSVYIYETGEWINMYVAKKKTKYEKNKYYTIYYVDWLDYTIQGEIRMSKDRLRLVYGSNTDKPIILDCYDLERID